MPCRFLCFLIPGETGKFGEETPPAARRASLLQAQGERELGLPPRCGVGAASALPLHLSIPGGSGQAAGAPFPGFN